MYFNCIEKATLEETNFGAAIRTSYFTVQLKNPWNR